MTTSCAFFFSTRHVTVFTPDRTTGGRFVGASIFPFTRSSARPFNRAFFSWRVSGRYLSIRRNSCVAVGIQLHHYFLLFTNQLQKYNNQNKLIHCESKKLGRFYFYCNFVKCWPILITFCIVTRNHLQIRYE